MRHKRLEHNCQDNAAGLIPSENMYRESAKNIAIPPGYKSYGVRWIATVRFRTHTVYGTY